MIVSNLNKGLEIANHQVYKYYITIILQCQPQSGLGGRVTPASEDVSSDSCEESPDLACLFRRLFAADVLYAPPHAPRIVSSGFLSQSGPVQQNTHLPLFP